MQQSHERGTGPLDPQEVEALRAWVAEDGEAAVVVGTKLSRFAVARLLGGMNVHVGTRLAAREALARRRGGRR